MNSEFGENTSIIPGSLGTSGGGNLIFKSLRIICVAGALSITGTHSALSAAQQTPRESIVQTDSGLTVEEAQTGSAEIMELRRLSGMTWDQLAQLFGVTPRTLHFWASGKGLTPSNEDKLHRTVATVRQIDRGSAKENRDALFMVQSDGIRPIDLIHAGNYGEVMRRLGETRFQRPVLVPLSTEARSWRAPMKPSDLTNALQTTVHRDIGRTRVARAVRIRNKSHGDETS
jgi:DNA-binding transcriptional regulator YiaG